ncbi:MAG TPA: SLC13 family permease, partial [Candidatus Thermoplasmatota archaeon]|nr:SLC13 family permease [Candidatus Thermoplasmatota archaeon]
MVFPAVAVFAATYVLLSFPMVARAGRRFVERARRRLDERSETGFVGFALLRRLGTGRAVDRAFGLPGIALCGGLAMLAVGAVGWREAADAVDLHVLAVLFGMMALVAALDLANVFEVAAAAVARRARSAAGLLVATALLTAGLSAIALNDAVVLLLTPVLVRACREMGLPVMPYLAVEAVAANVGSLATPVGNPQNVLIALSGGIAFLPWMRALLVPTLASLALAVLWALVLFRRD